MSDVNRKFIESLPVSNWEVYTDSGYKNISHSSKTIEYDVYEVILDNNTIIKCADDHIFINKDSEQVFAKDSLNQYLITTTGLSQVLSVKSLNYKESMYDLSVDSDAHTYFTNGVLSHNTTVATIILLHYALFNKEKRIALLANKGDAAREILDRIQIAFENLPKWMQSGVVLWNKGSIEFENGSRIIAASSSSSSIRGKSMSFVYIDECVGKNSLIQVRNKNGFIFNITIGEFYNLLATENNTSDYLIKNNNYQVLTKNGFQNIDGIKKSCSKENLNIYFDDETIFTCTEYHFIEKDYMFIPVCLLNVGDYINDRKIIQIRQNKNNIEVYDLLNVANGNAYITDGINSHNCAFLDNWTDFYASVFPTLTSGEKTKMLFTSCVTKDTYVYTDNGIQQVSEFVDDTKNGLYEIPQYSVYGHNKLRIGNLFYNSGYVDTRIIKTRSGDVECSLNHKWLCYDNGILDWKQTKDLVVGDYLIEQVGQECYGNDTDISDFNTIQNKITTNLAFMLGVYLKTKNFAEFFFNLVYPDMDEFIKYYCANIFEVPLRILKSPKDIQEAWIDGYLGNIKVVETYNKKLVYQLKSMLTNIGYVCTLEFTTKYILSIGDKHTSLYTNYVPILEITESKNNVYDFSLPNDENDIYCHSVTYNNVIGHQTPRGLNHFYEFWEGATKGKVDAAGNLEKNGFFPIFAPWYRVPGRGEKFKETILKGINYDYDRFRQEYECISGDSLVTIKSATNQVCNVPISSLPTKNTEYTILTTYGFETFHGIRKTVSNNNLKFVFSDNTSIITTLNHRFVSSNNTIIASTVSIGDVLSNKVIIDIINDNTNMVMYDILETESHSYIANGINNHNCEFLGSSGSLLNATALKELIAATQEPIARNDYLTQYEQPIKDHIYFLIADVSHGKGLDYSAFSVIDVTTIPYRQICVYRNNRITPADYASVIKHVGDLYNKAYVLVESNDLGGQVTYILRVEYDYENLLSTESAGRAGKKLSAGFGNSVEDGIRTTVSTKRIGCQVLKLLLEQHKLILWDKNTIKELQTFSKSGESYEAEPGFHDDLVMGLVMFSYITQDAYFKDISNGDVVSQLRDLEEDEVTDDLVPFGIVTSAADFLEPRYVKLGNDKTAWSEHSSNPFEDYY